MPGTNFQRMYYAHSTYEDSRYVLFGVPFDKTCTFRKGTRYGPAGIRDASANFETFMFEYKIDILDAEIHDAGNLDVMHASPEKMIEIVNKHSKKVVSDGKFPVMLGGEHSISPGCATAFDDISVLGIDAHADYYDEYENDKNNHACAMRRMVDKFGEENVLWAGIRSVGKDEVDCYPRVITSLEVMEKGIDLTIKEIEKRLKKDRMYISLDIDGIDPAYAPGTGTPVPFGLKPIEVKKIIDYFAPRLVGFDLVEVSPPLDHGVTAGLAASLIMEMFTVTHLAEK